MALKPYFVVPLDLGTIIAASEYAGFPATNLNRREAMGLTWKSAHSGGGHIVKGDFGSAKAVDYLCIVSANALSGTTFSLRMGATQANVDGGSPSYDSGGLTFINPSIVRVDGLYHAYIDISSVQTFRWWRIDIANHATDFQAAAIVMGQKVQPSRFYNLDFEYGVKDLGNLDFGRFGVFDEEPGIVLRTLAFTLAWQTEAEFETSFRPMMEQLGQRGIVYCCFDPTANTYRQNRTFMGVLSKSPFARGVKKPGTFTQDFEITSLI